MTDGTDLRAERLRAALRENLRRRKVQGRERAAADRTAGPDAEPAAEAGRKRHGPDSDKTGL